MIFSKRIVFCLFNDVIREKNSIIRISQHITRSIYEKNREKK